MDSHAVNHQPGIPKGRGTPTLPHMEICVPRDVQGQAGHGWRLPRVMEEGLPTSSQPEPTHANWEWTRTQAERSRPNTSVSQASFFLFLPSACPLVKPTTAFIKGNLGSLIIHRLYPGNGPFLFSLGHVDRTGCLRHSPEIFSRAGCPGGLGANTWDFSCGCCVQLRLLHAGFN